MSSEERGKDMYLTEFWRSDRSTLYESHYWNSDGGAATYNSVRFEEQQLNVPSDIKSFYLSMDTCIDSVNCRLAEFVVTTTGLPGYIMLLAT